MKLSIPLSFVLCALVLLGAAACGATGSTSPLADGADASGPSQSSGDDGGPGGSEGGAADAHDPGSASDGTPTRAACTGSFGSGLTTDHGRLDGYLVAIVQPGDRPCMDDSSHIHLQVKASGGVYDIAVNLDTLEAETDVALPGGAWSEGWHAGTKLDYPTDLLLHAPAFVQSTPSAQRARIEASLANANHVSIFATGYNASGAHDVHRRYSGRDGAIVINPLSAKAHVLAFRFTADSF